MPNSGGSWWARKPSIRWLIDQIPIDGCLLVFNAKSNTWRVKVHQTTVLVCHKISDNIISFRRGNHNGKCDLYITWKEDL